MQRTYAVFSFYCTGRVTFNPWGHDVIPDPAWTTFRILPVGVGIPLSCAVHHLKTNGTVVERKWSG